MMPGFIVSGTDTGVGKTIFAAGLTAALNARYWKPVQAGLDEETDSETVARLGGGAVRLIHPEAYRLHTPCSPHEAARIDAVEIGPLPLPQGDGALVVEGAGGVLVPLSSTRLMADQFADWGLPVILVARTLLGTINHSLLSLEALRSRGVAIAGVAFMGDANPVSEAAITELGKVVHLGRLPFLSPLTAETLGRAFADSIRLDAL